MLFRRTDKPAYPKENFIVTMPLDVINHGIQNAIVANSGSTQPFTI
ncbi:MAG: hypothetical protein LAP61_25505 [Acidobacteriia bacterium]|nr:hypothetical protein [Terriglobia bacterium]